MRAAHRSTRNISGKRGFNQPFEGKVTASDDCAGSPARRRPEVLLREFNIGRCARTMAVDQ
jgi:hypothetical protein